MNERSLSDVFDASRALQLFASSRSHVGVDDDAARAIQKVLVDRLNTTMRACLSGDSPAAPPPDADARVELEGLKSKHAEALTSIESLQAGQLALADELTAARDAARAAAAPPVPAAPVAPPQG